MEELFDRIEPESIDKNVFKLIGKEWMLICAGSEESYNMMTASWGTMGILWNKPIVQAFIRPQRHTYGFVENNDCFTLNFFDASYRKLLNKMGTESGKDTDKMNVPGLDAGQIGEGSMGFKQADMIIECKKIYSEKINPERFLSSEINLLYSEKDYHTVFTAEIKQVWKAKTPAKQ